MSLGVYSAHLLKVGHILGGTFPHTVMLCFFFEKPLLGEHHGVEHF
jgi:hypothetical protein